MLLKDLCSFVNVTTKARKPFPLEKSNGCIKRYLDCAVNQHFISDLLYELFFDFQYKRKPQ